MPSAFHILFKCEMAYLSSLRYEYDDMSDRAGAKATDLLRAASEESHTEDDLDEYVGNLMDEAAEMRRLGYAALATMAVSLVENHLKGFIKGAKAILPERASWRCLECAFLQQTGKKINQLSNYADFKHLLELSNAFKHNDGKAKEKLAKRLSLKDGEKIDYINLDWDRLFINAETFTDAMADAFGAATKEGYVGLSD